MAGGFNEGFPAKVSGFVDEEHDYAQTVEAAKQAGLTDERRAEAIRNFGGFVATQAMYEAVEAVPGVVRFGRTRMLMPEETPQV